MTSDYNHNIKKNVSNLEYIKFKILIALLLSGYVKSLYFGALYIENREINHLIIAILGAITVTYLLIHTYKHPKNINIILHCGILITFIGMLYRIFIIEQYVITQIQSLFLIVICSFYSLGAIWGIVYSLLFTFILPTHTLINGYIFNLFPEKGDDTYYITWTLFFVNMIFIIYVPYLYQIAIQSVIKRKAYLNNSLKESIEGNKEFTSIITHELKTPLNSVIGITNLLIEKNSNDDEKKDLEKLHIKATYLLNLINKILEYNKLNLNLTKQEITKLDIIYLIEEILDNNKTEIKSKSFQIIKNFSPEITNKLVITEVNRLSIAIRNLLEYFLRISPSESKITLTININNILPQNQRLLIFSIENSLLNLNELNEQHFFEPFTKTAYQTNEYKHTGLELSIAKKAIEQLNSNIEFYNTLKPGVNLLFKTPITLEKKTTTEKKNITQERAIDLSKLNILIVDDNAINLLFMKSLLSHWNISAKTITKGYDAITIVQNEYIDIILMDLHMPEISGFEISKKIRELEHYASQPYIIAVSAVNKEDIENNLKKHGINDFIPKPVNQNDLKQKLIEYYIKEL